MPNTREKLIARPWQPQDLIDDLQGIIDEECDNYLNTRRTTLCMARDYLKEHFAEPKWIPVAERLPTEADGTVLVCFPDVSPYNLKEPYPNAKHDRRVATGKYSQHSKTWYIGEFSVIGGPKPTFWMPLPEPPKGDE